MSGQRRGLLVLHVLAAAVMALAAAGRRRAPFAFLIVVGVAAIALGWGLTSTSSASLADLYCLVFPTYAVAAWEKKDRAIVGLLIWIVFAIGVVTIQHAGASNLVPAELTGVGAWIAGRVLRAQRSLASDLEEKLTLLAMERDERARLAVASERMRIARELHGVVAHSVVGMVLQAEAAERLLGDDESEADVALATVENTGRGALVEMRRILGVLRRSDDRGHLEPQPGVGQIHALVQRARDDGRPVDLLVVGDPMALPAAIDFGIYRILEEALNGASARQCGTLTVKLNFEAGDVELQVDTESQNPISWPTAAMRERVTMCRGELRAYAADGWWHLCARLPNQLQGGLT